MRGWSDKAKFNIFLLGHYVLDLGFRFPKAEILPVALFMDKADTWDKPPQEKISIRCGSTEIMAFQYRLIRLKAYEAVEYMHPLQEYVQEPTHKSKALPLTPVLNPYNFKL